jgi:hypothetical protein
MDGQIWLFVARLSERSDWEAIVRDFRRPIPPCLEWPGHQSLVEAQHLRTRTLWRWAAAAISRLLRRSTSCVGKSGERGAP